MSQFCASSINLSDLLLAAVGGVVVLHSMFFHLTRR